jgi:toxic protein SymE
MADDHSTGNAGPVKIPNERRITVGKFFYDYPPRKDDPSSSLGRSVPVPWVQMKGRWLAQAGFDIRAPVRIRVMQGCLVLTVEEA